MVELADDEVLLPGPRRHPRPRQRARPHRVGGLRQRHPRRGGRRRHHDRRHAAQQHPADHHGRRAGGEAGGRRRPGLGRRRLLGRRGPGQRRRPRTRCTRPGVFGFKCFLLDSGVEEFPHLAPAELRRRDGRDRAARRADDRARRGRRRDRRLRPRGGVRAASCDAGPTPPRSGRSRWSSTPPGATGGRAHVVHLSASGAVPALRAARADGVDVSRRDLPALPPLRGRRDPRRRHRAQVLPADPRRRPTATPSGQALVDGDIDLVVSDHSPCTADLKRQDTGDFAEAWGGIASLQLGPAGRVDRRPRARRTPGRRGRAGWPPPRPAGSGWPARARSPWAPTPTSASSRPTRSGSSTRRGCTTRTRSRPTPGVRSPAPSAQTWLRGATGRPAGRPRGRLLRRGE